MKVYQILLHVYEKSPTYISDMHLAANCTKTPYHGRCINFGCHASDLMLFAFCFLRCFEFSGLHKIYPTNADPLVHHEFLWPYADEGNMVLDSYCPSYTIIHQSKIN